MRAPRAAGFTLIELVIVMAITSLLATIAFIGQHQIQTRARFDSAVDKTIQNIAFARNSAQSNVNATGSGSETDTVVAGTVLEFDNRHYSDGYPLEELGYLYAPPDSQGNPDLNNLAEVPGSGIGGCPKVDHPEDDDECVVQFLSLDDNVTMSDPNTPGVVVSILMFVNTGHGFEVCHQTSTVNVGYGPACAATRAVPFVFKLNDIPEGLSATIQVDPVSGLTKRVN